MNAQDDRSHPPSHPRSRLEDEVLEILARTDQPASFSEHVRRKARQQRRDSFTPGADRLRAWTSALSEGGLFTGFILAAIFVMVVHGSSPLLARLAAIVGVVCLLAPIVTGFRGPRQTNVKRWRGRDVDLNPPTPEWMNALRDRFRRPPRL